MDSVRIEAQFGTPGYMALEYAGTEEGDPYDVFVVAQEDGHVGSAWVKRDEFIAAVEKVFNGKFVPNEIEED